jgi:hypothetical protein
MKQEKKKMKSTLFVLILALTTAFTACVKKDAEVRSFIVDVEQVATEIVREVDGKPEAGIDRAQQILDARRPQLKAKFDSLKELRGYQLSDEATKKFAEAIAENVGLVTGLQVKYAEKSIEDEKFANKLNKLSDDFNSIFGV